MLTLTATEVTRDFLIDQIFQNELDLMLARKWRSKSLCHHSLRNAQHAVNEILRRRRQIFELVGLHHFPLRDLLDIVDTMLVGVGE